MRYPSLVRPLIENREIHLTGLAMLHRIVTDDNAEALLNAARGKSKADIELLIVMYAPTAPVRSGVTYVPEKKISKTVSETLSPNATMQPPSVQDSGSFEVARRENIEDQPLVINVQPKARRIELRSPENYVFRANMTAEGHTKYQRLLDLETDSNPDRIVEAMVDERLAKLEAKKRGKLRRSAKAESAPVRGAALTSEAVAERNAAPTSEVAATRNAGRTFDTAATRNAAPTSDVATTPTGLAPRDGASHDSGERVGPKDNPRYVDAATKRAVYERDNGQCQFEAESGRKCLSGRNTHLHHVQNFAEGGPTTADNLEVRCACHNLYQGWLDFGTRGIAS